MAKGKKTGGRQKGSLNKRTVALNELNALREDGEDSYHFLQRILRNTAVDNHVRIDCAKALLPYQYSRMPQLTEVTGKDGGAIETRVSVRDQARTLADILLRAQVEGDK